MQFHASRLAGAFLIEPDRHVDDRGFFARIYCEKDFAARGLQTRFVQSSVAFNAHRGTLRGMHWQVGDDAEVKLVRVTRGSAFDVIVDLRSDSPTYLQWESFTLSAENHATLYIPRGFAHGYLTLSDDNEFSYQMSAFYNPSAGRGARYDDPAFKILWPEAPVHIHDRDRNYADYQA